MAWIRIVCTTYRKDWINHSCSNHWHGWVYALRPHNHRLIERLREMIEELKESK